MRFWLNRCVGVATAIMLISSPLLSVCVMLCGPAMAHHAATEALPPSGHEQHETAGPQLASAHSGHQTGEAEHRHHAEPASHAASVPVFAATIRAHVDCCIAGIAEATLSLAASRADGFPTPLVIVGLIPGSGDATTLAFSVSPAPQATSPPAPPRATRALRI